MAISLLVFIKSACFNKSVIPNKRRSTTPPPTIMKDGMLFEDPNEISEQCNNYF